MTNSEQSDPLRNTDEFAARNESELLIKSVCKSIERTLIEKNRAYGDSAFNPVRIFSRSSVDEQLRVRIDDKLSRILRGDPDAFGEDVYADLIGYLVLLIATGRYADAKR